MKLQLICGNFHCIVLNKLIKKLDQREEKADNTPNSARHALKRWVDSTTPVRRLLENAPAWVVATASRSSSTASSPSDAIQYASADDTRSPPGVTANQRRLAGANALQECMAILGLRLLPTLIDSWCYHDACAVYQYRFLLFRSPPLCVLSCVGALDYACAISQNSNLSGHLAEMKLKNVSTKFRVYEQ